MTIDFLLAARNPPQPESASKLVDRSRQPAGYTQQPNFRMEQRKAAKVMPGGYRYLGSLLLAAAFLASVGYATRTYRYFDPYYNDYPRWDGHEDVYYQQRVIETRRDRHDFRRLNDDERKEYWTWRHSHHDHDHDPDHDHDKH